MTRKPHVHPSDIAGLTRLATDVTREVTDLAEALHKTIASSPGIGGTPMEQRASGIAGFVYKTIRGVTGLVDGTTDSVVSEYGAALNEESTPEREAMLAIVNGVMGDRLEANGNPLAIAMRLRRKGKELKVEREALSKAFRAPRNKLLVMVHGLCMNDLQWARKGSDFGAALERDLGYTVVHLHYNSGLHTSSNGRGFARLLEALVQQWPEPLEELAMLTHSMGGLVARSAYYYGTVGGQAWPRHLRKLIFLGTPHHGSMLERGGNLIDISLGVSPYSAPFARLGKLRSAGITDLRHGNVLDEDWEGIDRFEPVGDRRHPAPLPEGVRCYAIAANIGKQAGGLIGDGMVPVSSALGQHEDPRLALSFAPSRQWVGYGMNHWALLREAAVYEQVRRWLGERE